MRKKKNLVMAEYFTILIIALTIFAGCSSKKKKPSQSMAQIQKKEGIPVVISTIKKQNFKKYLSFYGTLKAEKQTTIGSRIGGRIEKIYFKPGDKVKKDQTVIKFPEDAPASQFQQAKAAFENSKKNYKRIKALYKAGQTSKSNLDAITTKYLVDKRNYETMHQLLFLNAPYDGVITDIFVNEGDAIKSKKPLFTIAKLKKMRTKIWVNQNEISQIKKGMKAVAEINGKSFLGKVTQISLSVDPFHHAFYAMVVFNNNNFVLKSGIIANIKILVYENDNAIIVPRHLIMKNDKGLYVFLEKNSHAVEQYIQEGNFSGVNYEIISGLKVGDKLIVEGAAQLKNNTKVKVVK